MKRILLLEIGIKKQLFFSYRDFGFDKEMDSNRPDLEGYGYTVDTLYGNGTEIPNSLVSSTINDGRNLVFYEGHGGTQGWAGPALFASDVYAFNNANKLPFIISGGCYCGDFRGSTYPCFAEVWLTAGTIANPVGAIAVCMGTGAMGWSSTITQAAATDFIVAETQTTIGEIFFNSECILNDYYSAGYWTISDRKFIYCIYHLFGDPATPYWTKIPSTFNSVSVIDNNNSLVVNSGADNATICVSSLDSGVTYWNRQDNVSSYTFNTSVRPVYVTISKHNYIPATVYVSKNDTISGYILRTEGGEGVSGVVMNGLPGNPTTDANGYYMGIVQQGWGWSGTVKPTKAGYNFTPDSTIYTNLNQNTTTNYILKPYIITAKARGSGIITPKGDNTIICGDDQTFTITPNEGYHIGQLLVDGSAITPCTTYTFTNVTAHHTIFVTFNADVVAENTTEIPIIEGWNYISVPRVVSNDSVDVVFPGNYGSVFAYDPVSNDYYTVTTVSIGQGYIVYYENPTTIFITGPAAKADSAIYISPSGGWGLIGSREIPVKVNSLGITNGAEISGIQEIDPFTITYHLATEIKPGVVYWANMSKACTLYIGGVYVVRSVLGDTITWNGNILVDEDITIGGNTLLSINAGTRIRLKDDCSINVEEGSKVIADGSESAPIKFRKYDNNAWDRITLRGTGNQFRYCLFDGGTNNVEIRNDSTRFTHCRFSHATGKGIITDYDYNYNGLPYLWRWNSYTMKLDTCVIDSNQSGGIYLLFANTTINQSTISNNGGVGIGVDFSTITEFTNNVIENNYGYGIQAGTGCSLSMGNGTDPYEIPDPDTLMTAGAGKNRITNNHLEKLNDYEHRYEILVCDDGRLYMGEINQAMLKAGYNAIFSTGKYINNLAHEGMWENRTQWTVSAQMNRWDELDPSNKFTGPVTASVVLPLNFDPSREAGAGSGTTPSLLLRIPAEVGTRRPY